MLLILSIFVLLALVLSKDSAPTSPDDVNTSSLQPVLSSMGRVKYEDGEILLYQNRFKSTDIYFTPFPRVDPENSECYENIMSDHTELSLVVEFYTQQLVQHIEGYLKRRFSTLCAENETCDVSLLPMNAFRLVQKGLIPEKTRKMYTINDEWYPNTLSLQSLKFVIYMTNKSVCDDFRSSIIARCHLSNFELHYSLNSEKIVERQVEVTTEQVTETSIFKQIRSKFSGSDTIALTDKDFKQFINETIDKVTGKLREQEGIESQLQDPISLHRLLQKQLEFKQVRLEKVEDQLWHSLYWMSNQTRPDRLAKIINQIIYKNPNDTDHFICDSHLIKNIHKLGLTQQDIDQFNQLNKYTPTTYIHLSSSHSKDSKDKIEFDFKNFAIGGKSNSNKQLEVQEFKKGETMTDSTHDKKSYDESKDGTQVILSRTEVEKYLAQLSDHVHLKRELIRPKPIDVHSIQLGKLQSGMKLLSHTVFVRSRGNINILPLRCAPQKNRAVIDNTTSWYSSLADKVDQLTNLLSDMKNQFSGIKNQLSEVKNQSSDMRNQLSEVKNQSSDMRNQLFETKNHLSVVKTQFSKMKNQLSEVKNQSSDMKNQLSEAKNHLSVMKNQFSKMKNQFSDIKNQLCEVKNQSSDMKNQLSEATNHLSVMKNQFSEMKNQLSEVKNATSQSISDIKQKSNDRLIELETNCSRKVNDLSNRLIEAQHTISIEHEIQRMKLKKRIGALEFKLGFYTKWKQHPITVAGQNSRGNQSNQLSGPHGIFIDDDQTMYIADYYNHRIVKWIANATTGHIVAGGNGQGNQTNQLNCPTDVIVDKEKNSLIICDRHNRRIMRWSLRNNTTNGEIIIEDIRCYGLAMDKSGSLYVSDGGKDHVKRWKRGEKTGIVVAGGNGRGSQLNQLNGPQYMFIDDDYSLYVSDSYNHRVMKWIKDAKEGIVVAGGNGQGNSSTQLNEPCGVIVGKSGQIFVVDYYNQRVMCWWEGAKEGMIVVGGNGKGQKPNPLSNPIGLSFDQQGNLYVANCGNGRILKFEITLD